jgi:hypothetical protein
MSVLGHQLCRHAYGRVLFGLARTRFIRRMRHKLLSSGQHEEIQNSDAELRGIDVRQNLMNKCRSFIQSH